MELESDSPCVESGFRIPHELMCQIVRYAFSEYDVDDIDFYDLIRLRYVSVSTNAIVDSLVTGMTRLPPMLEQRVPPSKLLSQFPNLKHVRATADFDNALLNGLGAQLLSYSNGWVGGMHYLSIKSAATMTNLTSLNLAADQSKPCFGRAKGSSYIDDPALAYLTNLTHLNLSGVRHHSWRGLASLAPALLSLVVEGDGYDSVDQGVLLLTRLTSLSLRNNRCISNRGILTLTNLTALNLLGQRLGLINDDAVSRLSNLRSLQSNAELSDRATESLSHLTSLCINGRMSGKAFAHLQLRELGVIDRSYNYAGNMHITEDDLARQTALTSLELFQPMRLTGERWSLGMSNLTRLRCDNGVLADNALMHLTGLTQLRFCSFPPNGLCDDGVTDASMSVLTNLRVLHLDSVRRVGDASLSLLTRLEELLIGENSVVTDAGLVTLTRLRSLNISKAQFITPHGLSSLVSLRSLFCPYRFQVESSNLPQKIFVEYGKPDVATLKSIFRS